MFHKQPLNFSSLLYLTLLLSDELKSTMFELSVCGANPLNTFFRVFKVQ
jgi:hypothetical protein